MGDPVATSGTVSVVEAHPRLFLAAFLFVCCAYFMPGASWNPASRFALTRAIVEHGTFEITRYADSTGDRAKVGERFFSDKAPVPSLLAVPAYAAFHAVARARDKLPAFEALGPISNPAQRVRVSPAYRTGLYVCTLSTSGLAGVAVGLLLFELLRRRVSPRAAMAAAIATVIATPVYPYATSFFGHTIAGAFLLGAFALGATDSARRQRFVLAGACLALAIGSEYVTAVPAGILAAFFVWRAPREERARVASSLALGALPPLLVVGAYHQLCFGAPWRTGYAFVTQPIFVEGHAQGLLGMSYPKLEALYGLSFGHARGLFYLAPITALGVVALVLSARRERALRVASGVVAALWLVNASYYMWDGGWATGPRHLVPAMPFIGLGVGIATDRRGWRLPMLIAGVVSAAIMVLTVAIALEAPTQVDAIFDYLLPALRSGRIGRIPGASSWGLELGLGRSLSVLPVVIWIIAGATYLVARVGPWAKARSFR